MEGAEYPSKQEMKKGYTDRGSKDLNLLASPGLILLPVPPWYHPPGHSRTTTSLCIVGYIEHSMKNNGLCTPHSVKLHLPRVCFPQLEITTQALFLDCQTEGDSRGHRKELPHSQDPWNHFFFQPNKDIHTPTRAGIAMTTAEVQGEQVSGAACLLKSPQRARGCTHSWHKRCWQGF